MRRSISDIHDQISRALNGLPEVFSTVQWGGRAYKLPGPGGSKKRPKLLAHVTLARSGDAVFVDFKLDKRRAREVTHECRWIEPHPFRTLAPSGWVAAAVSTKSQCNALVRLLRESRGLHPIAQKSQALPRRSKQGAEFSAILQRIDAVVREKRAAGWSPDQDR